MHVYNTKSDTMRLAWVYATQTVQPPKPCESKGALASSPHLQPLLADIPQHFLQSPSPKTETDIDGRSRIEYWAAGDRGSQWKHRRNAREVTTQECVQQYALLVLALYWVTNLKSKCCAVIGRWGGRGGAGGINTLNKKYWWFNGLTMWMSPSNRKKDMCMTALKFL